MLEGLKHPMTQENKFIGQACTHKHKSYQEAKNPLKGSLLERNIQRAIYCIENDDKDMAVWFKLQSGVTPQEYIDKWSDRLL